MEQANYIKAIFTAVFAFLSALLGVLAVPVILLVACNLIDYATGLMASKYRAQDINSYKSIRGIFKKVSMWLLVVVGAIIDENASICINFNWLEVTGYISGGVCRGNVADLQ